MQNSDILGVKTAEAAAAEKATTMKKRKMPFSSQHVFCSDRFLVFNNNNVLRGVPLIDDEYNTRKIIPALKIKTWEFSKVRYPKYR